MNYFTQLDSRKVLGFYELDSMRVLDPEFRIIGVKRGLVLRDDMILFLLLTFAVNTFSGKRSAQKVLFDPLSFD